MTNKELSIIIVNWNTCKITCDCIESVYQESGNVEFEIIVIDNASSDNSVAQIKSLYPDIILIENKDNVGFGPANNQGMEIAKGEYILLLNSDTIVLDNAIDKTISFAKEHPEAGVLSCKILNTDKSLQPNCFMYPSLTNMLISAFYLNKLLPQNLFFGREEMSYWTHDSIKEVEVLRGCFMLLPKRIIDSVGMMDYEFFFYAEETDLCYRVKKSGYKVLFYPGAEIIHLGGQSSKIVRSAMLLQLRAGVLQFIKKHHSLIYYYLCCLLTSLWFTIRTVPWLIYSISKPSNFSRGVQMTKTYTIGAVKALMGWKGLALKRNG